MKRSIKSSGQRKKVPITRKNKLTKSQSRKSKIVKPPNQISRLKPAKARITKVARNQRKSLRRKLKSIVKVQHKRVKRINLRKLTLIMTFGKCFMEILTLILKITTMSSALKSTLMQKFLKKLRNLESKENKCGFCLNQWN